MTVNRATPILLMTTLLVSAASGQRDDRSLQEQIDAATRSGRQRLTVPQGEYVLDKSLTIRDAENFVLDGSGDVRILVDDTEEPVLTIRESNDVCVSNLYLSHVKPEPEYQCHGAVLDIDGCRNVSVVESELNGCGAIGIDATGVAGLVVRNCTIRSNSFNALYLSQCRAVKVIGNRIEDNANLMAAYDVDDLQMSDNEIRRNGGYWQPRIETPGRKPPRRLPIPDDRAVPRPVFRVSTPAEFVRAMGPHRIVQLAAGEYVLSDVFLSKTPPSGIAATGSCRPETVPGSASSAPAS